MEPPKLILQEVPARCQGQESKKGINIKNLAEPPPLPRPHPQEILYVWGLFSLQNTGKGIHKELRGGRVLGAPKFFMLNFFACFFVAPDRGGFLAERILQVFTFEPPDSCFFLRGLSH